MQCVICSTEIKRIGSPCTLVGGGCLCLKCCFSISAGESKMVKIIKERYGYYKDDFLRICDECIGEKKELVSLVEKESISFSGQLNSGIIETPEIKTNLDLSHSLEQIVFNSSDKDEIEVNLKYFLEESLDKFNKEGDNKVKELLEEAKERLKDKNVDEVIRLVKEAANVNG